MKKLALLFALAAAICSLQAGVHKKLPAKPFAMRNLAITFTEPEFSGAAGELSAYLGKIYRTQVPFAANSKGNIVFEKAKTGDAQGYIIVSTPEKIIIRAEDPMGAKYAAADLLYALGYRRFTPDEAWEIIPANPPKTLTIGKHESPDYLVRRIWPGWGYWPEYGKAGGVQHQWQFANRSGGLILNTGHSYEAFFRRYKKELAAHPEYVALYQGQRKSNKLCISNPGVRKLFTEFLLNQLRNNPNMYSVSADPSDCGGWCECENCKKIGNIADRAILLANEGAAAVSKEFPGKKVALYAYNEHSVPCTIKVHPDVIVNVTTGFIRGGNTPEQQVEAWGKRAAAIGIREYYYIGPAPGAGALANLKYLDTTIPKFYKMGARYMIAESNDAWGPGFVSMNFAIRKLWNINTQIDDVKTDILNHAFPNSKKAMAIFLDLLDGSKQRPLSKDLIARMYEALNTAWQQSAGQEKERIRQLIIYTHFCEKLLACNIKPSNANHQARLEAAFAGKPHHLLHTFGMHRSFIRKGRGIPKAVGSKFDWKKSYTIDAETVLKNGLKNNKKLPFATADFGTELTLQNIPTAVKGNGKLDPVRGQRDFYIYTDGKPFTIKVTGGLIPHYRNRGNVRIELVQLGGVSETGEFETLIQKDASVPPDGKTRSVTLKPKYAGLHRISYSDGNDRTSIVFPEDMAVALPIKNENDREVSGFFAVYVPANTKTIGFFAKTRRGAVYASNNRKMLFDLRKRNGYFSFDIKPSPKAQIFFIRYMGGTLRFLTIPNLLNVNYSKLIVPAKAVK